MKAKRRNAASVRTLSGWVMGWLLLFGCHCYADGVLDSLRNDVRLESSFADDSLDEDEVRTTDRRAKKSKSKRANRLASGFSSCDDDDSTFESQIEESLGRIFFYVASSPYWLPPSMLRDDYYAESYFARYPYVERFGREHHGYMLFDPAEIDDLSQHSFRATAQYGTSFDDLSHWGGRIQFDSRVRFGVDVASRWLEEETSTGEDDLNVGDANIVFRFAQSRRVQMRSGLGINWLTDDADTDLGFNFTYGADWFPDDPFVVSTHFDWGTLGETNMFHCRISGGVLMWGVETFVGYDYLEIGDFEKGSMIGGIRVWF